jgi:hypothetical protein
MRFSSRYLCIVLNYIPYSQVRNLSQNVDRAIGSSKAGICLCLTPSMIPYTMNSGGLMVGLEALSMQGLPIDDLLLTRETEDQLADLAGNAMSTTVVGASILAALAAGMKLLKAGDNVESYEEEKGLGRVEEEEDTAMDVDQLLTLPVEKCIVGEDELIQRPLDFSVTTEKSVHELLEDADKSSRLCKCEGRKYITSRELRRCADCGSSNAVDDRSVTCTPLTPMRTSGYLQEGTQIHASHVPVGVRHHIRAA